MSRFYGDNFILSGNNIVCMKIIYSVISSTMSGYLFVIACKLLFINLVSRELNLLVGLLWIYKSASDYHNKYQMNNSYFSYGIRCLTSVMINLYGFYGIKYVNSGKNHSILMAILVNQLLTILRTSYLTQIWIGQRINLLKS